eukprot:256355-Chlamydomonas_euryale.AAC.3
MASSSAHTARPAFAHATPCTIQRRRAGDALVGWVGRRTCLWAWRVPFYLEALHLRQRRRTRAQLAAPRRRRRRRCPHARAHASAMATALGRKRWRARAGRRAAPKVPLRGGAALAVGGGQTAWRLGRRRYAMIRHTSHCKTS